MFKCELLVIFDDNLEALLENIIKLEQLICFELDDCKKLDKRSLQLAKRLEISSQNNFEEIY